MKTKAVRLTVYGRVQGVGFRNYTQKKAEELNVEGWVMNMSDGSVFIEAEGEWERLNLFIDWCEDGPQWARVSSIKKQFVPPQGFSGFEVR